jgi:hypothetical protein
MSQHKRLSYPWIVDQLVKIKSLERQVNDVFAGAEGRPAAQLRPLVAELNLRLDILDGVLEFQPPKGSAIRAQR